MGQNKFLLYNLSLAKHIKCVLYVKVSGKFSGFFVGGETVSHDRATQWFGFFSLMLRKI